MAKKGNGRTASGKPITDELSEARRERAENEGRTNSELIRAALRRYLQAS